MWHAINDYENVYDDDDDNEPQQDVHTDDPCMSTYEIRNKAMIPFILFQCMVSSASFPTL